MSLEEKLRRVLGNVADEYPATVPSILSVFNSELKTYRDVIVARQTSVAHDKQLLPTVRLHFVDEDGFFLAAFDRMFPDVQKEGTE